jgi:hypothetical protein
MSNSDANSTEAAAPRARARRPELERDHPIRHFSTVFREAEPRRAEAQGGGGDSVSRAVELGYRVIDEYIRQGQKAASRMRDGRLNSESLQADVEELGMRMAQHASDFAAMFGELLARGGLDSEVKSDGRSPARPEEPPPASEPRASAGSPAPAPSAPARTQLRIAVLSARAAEVSVDLHPGAATRPLIAHALRLYRAEGDAEGAHERITDVAFEPGVPPTLRLRIGPTCAAGTYHGLLIDPDSSLPAGTLSVRVLEEPAP